jgi:thiol-disulfide isomerase/thioredoxin
MHRRIRHALALLALGTLGACAGRPPRVRLEPLTYDQFQQRLSAWRGRVVVVDVWATWCAPCLERFPRMVEMHRRYRDRGVQFVSLSVDNRDDRQALAEARRFLEQQQATFENYLLDENILQAFEKLDIMGIPAVFVYDRAGRLRRKLTGDDPNRQFTDQDVETALTALLY